VPNVEPRYGFPRWRRLVKRGEYEQVFAHPLKFTDTYFSVLAMPNPLGYARLGLVVSKKRVDRRAVQRNRLKRIIRESFRLQGLWAAGADIVVIARTGAALQSNRILFLSLARHWRNLEMQCATSSSS